MKKSVLPVLVFGLLSALWGGQAVAAPPAPKSTIDRNIDLSIWYKLTNGFLGEAWSSGDYYDKKAPTVMEKAGDFTRKLSDLSSAEVLNRLISKYLGEARAWDKYSNDDNVQIMDKNGSLARKLREIASTKPRNE